MPTPLPFLRLCLLCLSLWAMATGAHANSGGEEKKKEAPEEVEKVPTYVKEPGVDARGQNYKRVARDNKGEPEPVPKEPLPPAPVKEDKKADAKKEGGEHGGGHGEPAAEKKDDKKKKEEKKADAKKEGGGEHGGGHGEKKAEPEKKKPEFSKVYPRNVIRLGVDNRPTTAVMHSNRYADYFLCRDTISDGFRRTLLDELNTFADRLKLPRAQEIPCMVKVAKPDTKLPGAVFIEFYVNEDAARQCMRGGVCGSTRLVLLQPKAKSTKHTQPIYRSYVLTDEKKYVRGDFCVSPEGQFLAPKSCYAHLHPDWLFN